MEEIGVKAQELKDDLAHLVSEDSRAFNKVLDAVRLPAISEQDRKEKTKISYWQINMPLKSLTRQQKML